MNYQEANRDIALHNMNCEDGNYKYVLGMNECGRWEEIIPLRFFKSGHVVDINEKGSFEKWKLIEDEAPSDKNDDVIAMPQGSIPPLVEEWESVDPRA